MKLLGTIPEVQKATGLGRTSIYKLIKEKKLESVWYGRRHLVRWPSVEKLAASLGSEG